MNKFFLVVSPRLNRSYCYMLCDDLGAFKAMIYNLHMEKVSLGRPFFPLKSEALSKTSFSETLLKLIKPCECMDFFFFFKLKPRFGFVVYTKDVLWCNCNN